MRTAYATMVRSELHTVFMLLPPYSRRIVDPSSGKVFYRGTTMTPFLAIVKSLNITLHLQLLETGFWGDRLPNGTYTGPLRLAYDGRETAVVVSVQVVVVS